jgi:RsbT co-antagonist protein rsbRD N-terminal domain
MKNTEVRPESASGRLAAYLESHKEAMTSEWVGRVRKDSAVPTDFMTKPEIIDHIPQIFDAIIQALRQHRSDTTIEQVHQIAARHMIVRWIEHFNLQAVLRELSLLRAEFIYHLRVFEEEHPDFGIAARLFASTTIHQILDDAVIDTTNTFLKLTERDDRNA